MIMVIYSRFGPMLWLEDNIYKHDFPEAVQSLSPYDVIFINTTAHYGAEVAHNFELDKALAFIVQ